MKQYIKQTENGIEIFHNPLKAGNGDTIYNPPHERLLAEGWVEYTPTLEEARTEKLAELEAAFDTASHKAHCTSSVGFEIDADETANRNVSSLIVAMEANGEDSVLFCAYDNTFHEVTLDQLRIMQIEIITHARAVYARKWALREAIEAAQSVVELESLSISFSEENE